MRECRSCGRVNPDDADFCECGEYLRWDPTGLLPAVPAPTTSDAPASSDAADHAPDAAQPSPPTSRPAEPADPNMTIQSDGLAPPRSWAAAGAPLPSTAGPGDAPTGAASIDLTLPDGSRAPGAIVTPVEPGQRAFMFADVRNQSPVVDNLDLSIRGLPEGWWSIAPATVYLAPYGSREIYEHRVEVHIHPPRSPAAEARTWPFEVVARSRAYGSEVASAPASIIVQPFHEVATELRPQRGSGRLKARFRLVVRNKANAHTDVSLKATDADEECKFRWAAPKISLEPGAALECPFTVFPPKQIWIGRSLDRQLQVSATPVEVEPPPPPRQVVFRQRAWLPWWLAVVAVLAIAAAVIFIKLRPKPAPVPNLVGQKSPASAEQAAIKAGFKVAPVFGVKVDASKPAGSVAAQTPKAGTKAKPGSAIALVIYHAPKLSAKVTVPKLVGLTLDEADQSLSAASLKLGTFWPQPPPSPNAPIVSQIPAADKLAPRGSPITVFLKVPAKKKAAAAPSGPAQTTTGSNGSSTPATSTSTTGSTTPAASTSTTGSTTPAASSSTTGSTTPATSTSTTGSTTPATNTAKSSPQTTTTASTQTQKAGVGPVPPASAGSGPVTVPALTGSATAAAAALSQLGLVPKPVTEYATVPAGDIAGTVPTAGTKLAQGKSVKILVSSGSPLLAYDGGLANPSAKVFVVDPSTGKRPTVAPAGTGQQVEPAWSPDGSELVYSQNGQLVLDRRDKKGSAPKPLTTPPAGAADRNPAFAPSAKANVIAFIEQTQTPSTGATSTTALPATTTPAGGASTTPAGQPTTGSSLCFASLASLPVHPSCTTLPGWSLGGQVDWAPNGRQVLVLGSQNGGANFGILSFTSRVPFSTDATAWHGALKSNDATPSRGVFAAAISPDGKHMALVANVGSANANVFSLYIVRAGDFTPTRSAQRLSPACQVAWRPDGLELAVMQPAAGCGPYASGSIIAFNPSSPRALTQVATNAAHPVWQPVKQGGSAG